jgi:hypothetical protein
MSLRQNLRRSAVTTGAVTIAVCALLTVGAPAQARPIPSFQLFGNHIVPIPQGQCHGVIRVDHNHVPKRPDLDAITFVPIGTYGNRPGCEVMVAASWINGIPPFSHAATTKVTRGPEELTVRAGQGISLMVTLGIDKLNRPTWSNSGYMWLQP